MTMLRPSVLLSFPLLASALACGDPSGPTAAPQKLERLPRALTVGEQGIIRASNSFAFNLMREVNQSQADSNVFISPLSASMALGMTMNGAAGTTLDGMKTALSVQGLSMQEVNGSYRSLIDLLRGLDREVDFRIANSIWYHQSFPFEQSFFDVTKQYFDATVTGLSFADPAAPDRINAWVKTSTAGKIDKMIESIPGDMVMYLLNAIYFKGNWREQFEKAKTRQEPFFLEGGSTAQVSMMTGTVPARFATRSGVTMLELEYGNSAYTMTILLPPSGTSANAFVGSLDDATWARLTDTVPQGDVVVHLPKFTLRWEDSLNAPLRRMGMSQAFAPGGADFTAMSRLRGLELFISEVKQKTFVDVNEEGTEAAAVTSVGVGVVCACGPPDVRIDRPFVFALRERFSGTILFLGKIVAPKTS